MNLKNKLREAYAVKSKHSGYQIMPSLLKSIINTSDVEVNTRYEKERLDYILDRLSIKDKKVLDIGGNSGYFTFELVDNGAESVHLYEGNKEHCDFVEMARAALGLDSIVVTNKYYNFEDSDSSYYDVVLLLNVLHHIGDDYGDSNLSIKGAKNSIISQINKMSKVCDTMIFQLGFNWQGDTSKNLFESGTKKEMIDFIKAGTSDSWGVHSIGIPEGGIGDIVYNDLNTDNIDRNESLGEFLNRPLFILKSKNKR